MRRVLVTAGSTYGKLDDNKLVGNRIRGIWASKFAAYLAERGDEVALLVPDTFAVDLLPKRAHLTVVKHDGYYAYAEHCYELARKVDAAVMAAAVVNWIPKIPFRGKMPTEGLQEGAELSIPFILAPRVIDRLRALNPSLTLIGCKLTANAPDDALGSQKTIEAAHRTLERARAHVVVANDLASLKHKRLVYPDGAVFSYRADAATGQGTESFEAMYEALKKLIDDEHYRTTLEPNPMADTGALDAASKRMARIIEKFRGRFLHLVGTRSRVFGAIALRVGARGALVSPREKGVLWTASECVLVTKVEQRTVFTLGGVKPALNTPLLIRLLDQFPQVGTAVLHLHESLGKGVPKVPYAPASTVRDNERAIPAPAFDIDGHGFVAMLNENDEPCLT